MIKTLIYIATFFLVQSLFGQNPENLVNGNTAFALDIYRQLARNTKNENIFISPYNISEALALCYIGAANNTEKEMRQVLHLPENQSDLHKGFQDLKHSLVKNTDSITLITANSLWAQNGYVFNKNYTELIQSDYKAPIKYVNFKKKSSRKKAVNVINNWVDNNTDHQINHLIAEDDVTKDSRLLLINAIWFYGEWMTEFNPKFTKEGIFKSTDKDQKTMFMANNQRSLYYEDDIVTAIKIPYKGDKQNLVIFLPTKNDGIIDLEKNFAPDYISSIFNDMSSRELRIIIPKFSAEYNVDLKNILVELGIVDAFTNAADFSEMRKEDDLKIDKILHKAKVDVSEKGTKAAAATSVIMIKKTAVLHETTFVADHPFIYMIQDNETGTILFLGKMAYVK